MNQMHHLLRALFLCTILSISSNLFGSNPPSAPDAYSKIADMWKQKDITGLDAFLNDFYTQNPKYIPAILGAAFRDAIFFGRLPEAQLKLTIIKNCIKDGAIEVTAEFAQSLASLSRQLEMEMQMHARHGTTDIQLQANASAMAVRNAWQDAPMPYIEIVKLSPSLSIK
jgi:hypothetical protein